MTKNRSADEITRVAGEPGSSEIAEIAGRFGFGLDDDRWLAEVRAADARWSSDRFGDYTELIPIGRGGQGVVYRAFDPRTRRTVAIKRLSAGFFATPQMRARFEREIEAAAALSHPHIVTVYGSEQIDGQLVLTMQLVDGVPFDQWAAPPGGARRDIRETLSAFLTVCDAVQHAHQRGVIHRDLKPTNILVDHGGGPHVLDFGLAKLATAEDGAASLFTGSGDFLGTPAFAAPEQARGDLRSIDVRTDVYALGAVLYRALTGVFVVDPALPLAAALRAVLESDPPAASTHNHALGRELDAILGKALAKDPAARYSSVEALSADIRRYLGGEPVLAHPPSAAYRARKFLRRHWLAAATVSGFVLLSTAAAVTSTMLYLRAEEQRRRADDALRRFNVEAGTARGVKSILDDILVNAGKTGKARGGALTVRELLDRAAENINEERSFTPPAEVASLRMTIGDAYREIGMDAAAEPQYREALGLLRELYGPETYQVAHCLDALARTHRALGRLPEAEAMIEQAYAIYEKTLGEGDGFLARAANSVGLIKRHAGKLEEAERWYRIALRRYKMLGENHESVPYVLNNIGSLCVTAGRFGEAVASYREALQRSRAIWGAAPHMDAAMAQSGLADALTLLGDPDGDAEPHFLESRAAMMAVGGEFFRSAQLMVRYARLLTADARHDDAAAELEEAHRIFLSVDRWGDALGAARLRAEALISAGRGDEALADLQQQVDRLAPRVAPNDAGLAQACLVLGALHAERGAAEDADYFLNCAEAGLEAAAGPASSQLLRLRELRARLAPR